MKYCFVINRFAGKGKYVEELQKNIAEHCGNAGVEYDVCLSDHIGAAKEYIERLVSERKEGEEIAFFACGGDGTLCETVNAVMSLKDKSNVFVGLIPTGTGNDSVRNFGSSEPFFDIKAQIAAKPYYIDLLNCNGMYAINMVNIGFDCEVVVKTADMKKKPFIPSKFAYIAGLVATLIKKPGVSMKASEDGGEAKDARLLLTTFANGEFCGGGFHSNPRAKLNDSKIDTLFVNNISRMKFISLVSYYKKGTHLDNERFAKIIAHKKLDRIDMVFGKETNISVDGEVIQAKELSLSIESDAIGFLIPDGALSDGLDPVERLGEAII